MSKLVISIDSDIIDSDLTDFPLLIVLNSANLTSTELLAINSDSKKVSFVDLDDNDLYAEIESTTSSETRYWVKVTSVSSSADTVITFEHGLASDNSYVGDTGDTAAQAVWSNGYEAVYHMCQDPSGGTDAILDSTDNENHGTADGSMVSEDLTYVTDVGYNVSFDGSDDYIVSKNNTGLSGASVRTLDVYAKDQGSDTWGRVLALGAGSSLAAFSIAQYQSSGNWGFSLWNSDHDSGEAFDSWTWVSCTYDGSDIIAYVGGDETNNSAVAANTTDSLVGVCAMPDGNYQGEFDISEVRVSSVSRSADWIKADNYNVKNSLITILDVYKISGSILDGSDNVLEDESGTPLAVAVFLHKESTGELIDSTTTSTTTGEYEFTYIPDDDYYIVATPDGYQAQIFNGVSSVEMD